MLIKQLVLFLCLVSLSVTACGNSNDDVPATVVSVVEAPDELHYFYWHDLALIEDGLFSLSVELDMAAHRRMMAEIRRRMEQDHKDAAECRALLSHRSKIKSEEDARLLELLACEVFVEVRIQQYDKALARAAHHP